MKNSYSIADIQPLVDQGLNDVEIGRKLNLHKSTVGKIRHGIIDSSREIGTKKKLTERPISCPIWEVMGTEYYRVVIGTAKKAAWYMDIGSIQDVVDYLLDWLYGQSEKLIAKLRSIEKPHAYLASCLYWACVGRYGQRKKQSRVLVSMDVDTLDLMAA